MKYCNVLRVSFASVLSLVLFACGTTSPTGNAGRATSCRYEQLAVAPLLRDDVTWFRLGGFDFSPLTRTEGAWDVSSTAFKMIGEMLPCSRLERLVLKSWPAAANAAELAKWLAARSTATARGAAASQAVPVLVMRQDAISVAGLGYEPVRDFIGSGIAGLVVGAATKEAQYQPRFVVSIPVGLDRQFGTRPSCMVSLNAALVNPATATVINDARNLSGREEIPGGPWPERMDDLTAEQRRTIHTHCVAALRRAVGQVVSALRLADQ